MDRNRLEVKVSQENSTEKSAESYKIEWIGIRSASKPNLLNDIWGTLSFGDGKLYAFWGSEGSGRLTFKCHLGPSSIYGESFQWLRANVKHELDRLIFNQRLKGYKEIHPDLYEERIEPNFKSRINVEIMATILSENYPNFDML